MAKIIRFHELGGPEVLRIEDEVSRLPGKGEARIKVQAAGLNRSEAMYMRDQYVQ
jgi:NADPH:quinone reductase-like Zn-dependent oxidoreductase